MKRVIFLITLAVLMIACEKDEEKQNIYDETVLPEIPYGDAQEVILKLRDIGADTVIYFYPCNNGERYGFMFSRPEENQQWKREEVTETCGTE